MSKRSTISDVEVLRAYEESAVARPQAIRGAPLPWPEKILSARHGCHEKVALAAMERALSRGLIDYGVILRAGWVTEKGKALLRQERA